MTVAPGSTTTGKQADLAQQLTKELAAQTLAGGQHRAGSSIGCVVASVS
jgi:hypothetical protein